MRINSIRKTAIGIVSAAVCSIISATAIAGATQARGTFWEEIACPSSDGGYSEPIYLEGSYRLLTQYVEAGDHVTSTYQIFWEGTGYGVSSGTEYLLHGKWMEVIQDDPPYVLIWNDYFELVGKGRAENFKIWWKARVVETPDGETIMDYFDALQCETLDFGIQ
jgi:hypothetical protein